MSFKNVYMQTFQIWKKLFFPLAGIYLILCFSGIFLQTIAVNFLTQISFGILTWVCFLWFSSAAYKAAISIHNHRTCHWKEVFLSARSKVLSFLTTHLMFWLFAVMGCAFLLPKMIVNDLMEMPVPWLLQLGLISVFVYLILLTIRTAFIFPVMVNEDKDRSNSWKKSVELARGSKWRLLGCLLPFFAIILSLPTAIMISVILGKQFTGTEKQVYFIIFSNIYSFLIVAFMPAFFTALYFNRLEEVKVKP